MRLFSLNANRSLVNEIHRHLTMLYMYMYLFKAGPANISDIDNSNQQYSITFYTAYFIISKVQLCNFCIIAKIDVYWLYTQCIYMYMHM